MVADPQRPAGEQPPRRVGPARTSRRRLLVDRSARWIVIAGGMTIIACILGILIFIVVEVLPLGSPPRVEVAASVALAEEPLALVGDEYRSHVVGITADGAAVAWRVRDGAEVERKPLALPLEAATAAAPDAPGVGLTGGALPAVAKVRVLTAQAVGEPAALAAALDDGRVAMITIAWESTFDAATARTTLPVLGTPVVFEMDPERRPLGPFSVAPKEDGTATVAAARADQTLAIVRRSTTENMMTGEVISAVESFVAPLPSPLSALVVDADGRSLYGGTDRGEIFWWELQEGGLGEPRTVSAGPSPITALTLLIGGRALVVGQADGSLSVWFQVRQADDSFRLTRVRDFAGHSAAITQVSASGRNKAFLALDRAGTMGLYYSTSHRTLWRGSAPVPGVSALLFAPKADGAFLSGNGRLAALDIHNPHPEVSLRALFGRVWYEGYQGPEFSWQSTGGTDDFEPKLSLTPLLVGTLKGTVYSLLLAIPLGVLGAMYASQFLHPKLLRVVKPTVEIMAALPSVVLGFLAGLWLAPHVERSFPGLLLMVVVLPILVLLAGVAWRALPRSLRGRFPAGSEMFLSAAVLGLGIWGCLLAAPAFSALAFGGDFQTWLRETTGLPYDQRNAVVVGLAMGFAVIPIIFAISEDAFSNVPRNLVSGSLALGATRWQTVTRVVLPSASPGIFSAIMIGFGRAVGETMIVLMATGNTPIMSWNPFNGFRTLSANIAVEIPEAPMGGTLYRTLFLAALLLFVLTFAVNTAAEIVRQRLRRRYSEL